MDTLKDFVIYILANYPNPSELSKARLVKILYLADWKSALDYERQLTKIEWYFNHYGPYVEDVMNLVKSDSRNFRVEIKQSHYGDYKESIYLLSEHEMPLLSEVSKSVIDFVIKISYPLYWNKFIELIYSTYPIQQSNRYSYLDLVGISNQYKKLGLYKYAMAA
jgi:hypothetical protein